MDRILNGLGNFLKDLLYNKDNEHLEIARLTTLLSSIAYWAYVWSSKPSDPMQVGAGYAAIVVACAAWIYYRQKMELEFRKNGT